MMDMVRQIREQNSNEKEDRIPDSEHLYREFANEFGEPEDLIRYYLRVLNDAHYIFIIHMVEPDERLMIDGVNGYVVCDAELIGQLKEYGYRMLEHAYEVQNYRRKQASVIVKEMMMDVKKYNNTPLGRALNVAIMLNQFETVMENHIKEYTDEWKARRLEELMTGLDEESGPAAKKKAAQANSDPGLTDHDDVYSAPSEEAPRRAVDNTAYQKLQEMDLSGAWGRSVKQFGVQFLIRVHLRKYEFDELRKLIRQKKIAKEEDLRFIRDSVRKMEYRIIDDPKLNDYSQEMTELRRAAQLRLNQLVLANKPASAAVSETQAESISHDIDLPDIDDEDVEV